MRSINKVILIGNLTRDPEVRTTPGGQNVVTFSLATNREWVTKDGRKQSSTEFHDCVAWANLADICGRFLKKSKLVYVEGYLKTRNWNAPDGQKKFRTEIVVQDLIMLDKKGGTESDEFLPRENDLRSNGSDQGNDEPNEFDSGAAVDPETAGKKMEAAHRPPRRETHQREERQPEKKQPAEETPAQEQNPSVPKTLDIDQDLGL